MVEFNGFSLPSLDRLSQLRGVMKRSINSFLEILRQLPEPFLHPINELEMGGSLEQNER